MAFEYHIEKSVANKAKHGIDFEEAQEIWRDENRLQVPAKNTNEPRYQVIGRIGEVIWSAFITYPYENIRIISVRRARPSEEASYRAD